MKKIREIIRLNYENGIVSHRKISRAVNVSRPVVAQYLTDFKASGFKYQDIENMPDDTLEEIFRGSNRSKKKKFEILSGQFEFFAKELKRTGVTLYRLWEEYKADKTDFYSYSQFCYHFQVWRSSSAITMHIEHKAGDKMFCDFTGKKLSVVDRWTGLAREVEVFVSILGASQLTYVEAMESQQKADWIKANENSFYYFGGVTQAIVPDNLLSAVTKADKYEPTINPQYNDFARHYDTVILPARAGKPKDKSLVENAVGIVYAWIFAALRNRTFYSLDELNAAIKEELETYNNKPMQKLKVSRRDLFNDIEKSALKPLPVDLYEWKEFARMKTQFNYHVYLREDNCYYSVPFRYRNKYVELIYSTSTVEIYYKNIRIAYHKRDRSGKRYITKTEHMPPNHKWMNDWNPDKLRNWALSFGVSTHKLIDIILNSYKHPEQAYKVCLGILNLSKKYSGLRLDKACRRALAFQLYTLKGVKNILDNNLENTPIEEQELFNCTLPEHENIRGKDYYQ